jgi:hypothetical protein
MIKRVLLQTEVRAILWAIVLRSRMIALSLDLFHAYLKLKQYPRYGICSQASLSSWSVFISSSW